MAAHARLKNEFTEDESYHNHMTWLILYTDLSNHVKNHKYDIHAVENKTKKKKKKKKKKNGEMLSFS